MSAATDNLRSIQRRIDSDGVFVAVSRQALDECLEQHAELLAALMWALGRLSDARNVCYGGVTVEEIEEREAVLTKATGK